MQCQRPYVFINKDIYTRISICTFFCYNIFLYFYTEFGFPTGVTQRTIDERQNRNATTQPSGAGE